MRRVVPQNTCAEYGCTAVLDRRNKSGLCRSHCSKAMFRDPAFVERIREGCRAKHREPAFKARLSQNLRDLHKDPEFATAHLDRLYIRHTGSRNDDAIRKPRMSEAERADYRTLRGYEYSVTEALTEIGRLDLLEVA